MQFSASSPGFEPNEQRLLETVRILDRQILAAAEKPLSTEQAADLLAWTHQHLLAVVIHLLQSPTGAKRRTKRLAGTGIGFCLSCIDVIHLLVRREATVDSALKFRAGASLPADDREKLATANGERSTNPTVITFGRAAVSRFQRQLTRVAKRTRPHPQTELDGIWHAADTNLLACALKWFHLGESLDLPFPFPEPELGALLYVEAAKGTLSVAWTIRGPVFKMDKRPPGCPPAAREGLPA